MLTKVLRQFTLVVMKENAKNNAISELFEVLYVAMEFERAKRKYGTDVDISSSEIYLLKCIADNPNCNVTSLAKTFDVSKSAISQSVKKIKCKDLIKVENDAKNQSRYLINLSEKGEKAHKEHMDLKTSLFNQIKKALDGYDDDISDKMYNILKEVKLELKNFV